MKSARHTNLGQFLTTQSRLSNYLTNPRAKANCTRPLVPKERCYVEIYGSNTSTYRHMIHLWPVKKVECFLYTEHLSTSKIHINNNNKPMLRSGLITVNEEPSRWHFQSDAQQLPLELHGFLLQLKPCA